MKWELIDRQECYRGFFKLEKLRLRHELFDGGWSPVLERELMQHGQHSHAVAVLPYDPRRDEVILIEQFRAGAITSPQGPWMLEIIAGLVETGESVEEVAYRETREEAGCALQTLIPVYDYYPTPAGYAEHVSLFIGRVDAEGVSGIHGLAEEGEDIRVTAVDANTAFSMLEEGVIRNSIAIIGLQWLQINRRKLREMWC